MAENKQWYKQMVKQMNDKLAEHQGIKKQDDFPLMGRDKKIHSKLEPKKPEAPKKPGSEVTMDWIKEQKQKLTQKSEKTDTHTARWESRSGKHWVNLTDHGDGSYSYSAPDGGGHLGRLPSKDHAVKEIQRRVDQGLFQPDAAKTSMKRVK